MSDNKPVVCESPSVSPPPSGLKADNEDSVSACENSTSLIGEHTKTSQSFTQRAHRRVPSSLLFATARSSNLFQSFSGHGLDASTESHSIETGSHLRFSTVSLLTVWVVDCIGGLLCFLLAEIYQDFYPAFPLVFFLALGSHLNLIAGVFVFLLGRAKYGQAYRVYQPFNGGVRFVSLQCIGVSCVSASLLCTAAFVLTFKSGVVHSRGVLTSLAVLALLGNVIVAVSIRHFEDSKLAPSQRGSPSVVVLDATKRPSFSRLLVMLRRRPNAETALVAAFLSAQCLLTFAAVAAPQLQRYIAFINLLIQVCCGACTRFLIDKKDVMQSGGEGTYSSKGLENLVYGIIIRLFYVASVLANVVLLSASSGPLFSTTFFVVEAVNLISCSVMVLFIRTTHRDTSTRLNSACRLGGAVTLVISLLLGSLTIGVLHYKQQHPESLELIVEGTSWSYDAVLSFLAGLAQVLSLFCMPLTYVAGGVIHGSRFNILSPKKNQELISVLIIQVLGCLFFIAGVLCTAFYFAAKEPITGVLGVTLSTLSLCCMIFSIRQFNAVVGVVSSWTTCSSQTGGTSATQAEGAEPSPVPPLSEADVCYGRNTDASPSTELSYIINDEMIVSYLLSLANVMLRVVVDISLHRIWGDVVLPHMKLITLANICFLVSVPLAHYSARGKGIRTFHPFSGSGSYVALQVLGWMLYAMFTIAIAFSSVVMYSSKKSTLEWMPMLDGNGFFLHYLAFWSLFQWVSLPYPLSLKRDIR